MTARRNAAGIVQAVAAAISVAFAIASCGDTPAPPPKTAAPAALPTAFGPPPVPPQMVMTDTPSSVQPSPGAAAAPPPARPAIASAAAGPYQAGITAFVNGDLETAKNSFQQATLADPNSHQAFYSLGVVQERLRDPGAAASYRQAFTIVPDYEPAIIAYAMHLAKKGALGEAERILFEKRGQMPKSAAITATLAEVKSLAKDTGEAQRLAQAALKLNPDYRPAMVIIARDHYRNRRLDLALYALQAILDGFEPVAENPPRDKDNAEAKLLRGLIYREQGLRAAAMEEFKRAVQIRPDLVEARVQLATYLLEAGNAEEALPVLEGAIRFDSEHIAARLNLGDAYRLLGRYQDAKREFEWVLARDASLPQVHYDLGLLYLFAPSIPGMTAKQQVVEATRSLKRFQELRRKSESDDSEELLNRAKLKESEINAAALAAQPVAPPPTEAGDAGVDAGPADPAAQAPGTEAPAADADASAPVGETPAAAGQDAGAP